MGAPNESDYGCREWLRWVHRMALRMASMGLQNGLFMALEHGFDGCTDGLYGFSVAI